LRRCLLVTRLDVRVDLLGPGAPGLLHRVKVRIRIKTQRVERAQFVAAARAVARRCPAVVRRFAEAGRVRGTNFSVTLSTLRTSDTI